MSPCECAIVCDCSCWCTLNLETAGILSQVAVLLDTSGTQGKVKHRVLMLKGWLHLDLCLHVLTSYRVCVNASPLRFPNMHDMYAYILKNTNYLVHMCLYAWDTCVCVCVRTHMSGYVSVFK